jgi:hypothetical protein
MDPVLIEQGFYPAGFSPPGRPSVLKSTAMDAERKGLGARLASGWSAIVRAFTPSRPPGLPDLDGSDTTMFGPGPEPVDKPARTGRNEFWGGGDSSYLSEHEDADSRRRR